MSPQTYTTLIDSAALYGLLESPDPRIVDCRHDLADPDAGRQAWLQAHVPGAIHAHLDRDLSGSIGAGTGRHPLPSPAVLDDFLSRAGIAPATQVVAYDASHGAFASRLWWLLRWRGHERVAVLDGGFAAWQAAGFPVTSGETRVQRVEFQPREPLESVAATAEIERLADGKHETDEREESIAEDREFLVDARAAERFSGEHEPVDPVAGHVPHAINRPFMANVTSAHRFLPPGQLAQRFPQGKTIHMCGSGVTACHNILALRVAGRADGRLYAGSWSEWIRNPDHPVSKGPTNKDSTGPHSQNSQNSPVDRGD